MSAPLVVNTKDGMCWTRRSVTSSGLALYAPEGVCSCPEFVMATLVELAEHGIVGSADVLPMPMSSPVEEPIAYSLTEAAEELPTVDTDTLAAWLHWRFGPHGQRWNSLDTDDQALWEHHARAVRRAVARGGFKSNGVEVTLALGRRDGEDVTPQVTKLRALLAGQRTAVEGEHYTSVHHTYRVPRDLPEMGGA